MKKKTAAAAATGDKTRQELCGGVRSVAVGLHVDDERIRIQDQMSATGYIGPVIVPTPKLHDNDNSAAVSVNDLLKSQLLRRR